MNTIEERLSILEQAIGLKGEMATVELKEVNMESLIGSNILCEFRDDNSGVNWVFGHLVEALNGERCKFFRKECSSWEYCRPAMSPYIHACPEGFEDKNPLPKGLKIKAYSRDGDSRIYDNCNLTALFNHHRYGRIPEYDIIAFEILGAADGYKELV